MTSIFLGLFVVLVALVVRSSLGQPGIMIKIMIHCLGGLVGLWIVDLMLSVVGLEIPINIFSIILVGLLGFPGVIMFTVLQILGI